VAELATATGTTSFANFGADMQGVIASSVNGYNIEGSVIKAGPATFSFLFSVSSEMVVSHYWIVADLLGGARSALNGAFHMLTEGTTDMIVDNGFAAMYSTVPAFQQFYAGMYKTTFEGSPDIQVTWDSVDTRLETTIDIITYYFQLADDATRLYDVKDTFVGAHFFYLLMMPQEVAALFTTVYGCVPATNVYTWKDNSPR
jgi:hypothetical protein